MPVVGVNRDALFKALGRNYSERLPASSGPRGAHAPSPPAPARPAPAAAPRPPPAAEEEFEELCFEYGIELDDVVRRRRPPACRRHLLRLAAVLLPTGVPMRAALPNTLLQTSEKEMMRKELANANVDISGASEEVRPRAARCRRPAAAAPLVHLFHACS